MKKSNVNGLKKLEFTKMIIAQLTNNQADKIKGGETEQNTCVQWSFDGGCDSLKTYTKESGCNGTN